MPPPSTKTLVLVIFAIVLFILFGRIRSAFGI